MMHQPAGRIIRTPGDRRFRPLNEWCPSSRWRNYHLMEETSACGARADRLCVLLWACEEKLLCEAKAAPQTQHEKEDEK